MARYGRAPDELKVTPGLSVVVARTDQEARDKFESLQSLVDFTRGVFLFGVDVTKLDLDGPLPDDLPEPENGKGRMKQLVELARRENLTVRQLVLRFGVARGHLQVIGSPTHVADVIEEWYTQEGADGFNVVPPLLPGGFEDFVELVVPELQRRGLFHREYAGATYRENLGLPRPANGRTRRKSAPAARPCRRCRPPLPELRRRANRAAATIAPPTSAAGAGRAAHRPDRAPRVLVEEKRDGRWRRRVVRSRRIPPPPRSPASRGSIHLRRLRRPWPRRPHSPSATASTAASKLCPCARPATTTARHHQRHHQPRPRPRPRPRLSFHQTRPRCTARATPSPLPRARPLHPTPRRCWPSRATTRRPLLTWQHRRQRICERRHLCRRPGAGFPAHRPLPLITWPAGRRVERK